MELVENITQSFSKGEFTIGVFIDLSKAFDTVNHEILLEKLKCYGITGKTHQWLKSYLTNRKQSVQVDHGKYTEMQDITCGVPQGSILGPLLFLVYLNDLPNASQIISTVMFADDTNLFFSDRNAKEALNTMNKELVNIA